MACTKGPVLLALLGVCTVVQAGPPFLTDDPEPVDLHHTEVNLALQGTRAADATSGSVAADVNHGCASETQCHIAVPVGFNRPAGGSMQAGVGDVELGVKYRFVNRTASGFMAAVYPTVFLPTGDSSRGLGNGRPQVWLPLWLQQSSGTWTWDAGTGYLTNPAPGARNSWFFGLLAQRALGERLKLGAEVFHRTPVADAAPHTTGFNVGATVRMAKDRNLLLSIGRGLQGVSANRGTLYLAWQLEL
ncbi:transporter [Ramlibacter sp. G-1-2-2]|uniref:Transporter n=1 Tax=Ramlibacter agri TaxID=2728837 RepID=A0A848H183_9BURK|nr:transporter [Ramlibacter agri]NML43289.1 transporter [Ramlibacter agri]